MEPYRKSGAACNNGQVRTTDACHGLLGRRDGYGDLPLAPIVPPSTPKVIHDLVRLNRVIQSRLIHTQESALPSDRRGRPLDCGAELCAARACCRRRVSCRVPLVTPQGGVWVLGLPHLPLRTPWSVSLSLSFSFSLSFSLSPSLYLSLATSLSLVSPPQILAGSRRTSLFQEKAGVSNMKVAVCRPMKFAVCRKRPMKFAL